MPPCIAESAVAVVTLLGVIVVSCDGDAQWRNKVAVGLRASIPKGPPLPPKKRLKNSVGQILGPPQRWASVHCTPCTPYCYATGDAARRLSSAGHGINHPNSYCCIHSLTRPVDSRLLNWIVVNYSREPRRRSTANGHFSPGHFPTFYLVPGRRAKYCVCMSVRSRAYLKNHSPNFAE